MSKKLMFGLAAGLVLGGLLIFGGCTAQVVQVVEETTTTTACEGATTTTTAGETTTTAAGATTTTSAGVTTTTAAGATTTTSTTTTTLPPQGTAITGTISTEGHGALNITVVLSGASSGVATTGADGAYSFTGLDDGNYTVTPQSYGYTFSPSQGASVVLSGTNKAADFAAYPKIVFVSNQDNPYYDIYIMDINGQSVQRLTSNGSNLFPAISPDKTKTIFAHGSGSNSQIYTVNLANTAEVFCLSAVSGSSGDTSPRYTPTGNRIVFASTREGQSQKDIYIMKPNGTEAQRLTTHEADDDWPNVSPDGAKITFHSSREGNYDIYEMNLNGSNLTRITTSAADDECPDYLTDDTIVFMSDRDDDPEAPVYWDLFTISDGSTASFVAYGISSAMWPAASPYGTKVVYTMTSGVSYDLDIKDVATGGTTPLTPVDENLSFHPSF